MAKLNTTNHRKMKTEYLKFIKWKGEYAYFKKATLVDKILYITPMLRIMGKLVNIPQVNIILLRCPKGLKEEKVKELDTLNSTKVEGDKWVR